MTALADLLDLASGPVSPIAAPTGAERGPEDRLLDHERGYWAIAATVHGLLPGVTSAMLEDVVAAATLLAPVVLEDLDGVLTRVPAVAELPRDRRDALRAWLLHVYPVGEGGRFEGLVPDRLAERLTGRRLLDTITPCVIDALAASAGDTHAQRLLTVSTRAAAHTVFGPHVAQRVTELCVRHPALLVAAVHVAPQVEDPAPLLRALDTAATDPATDITVLQRLSDTFPHQSQILAEAAATVARGLVDRERQALATGSQHDDAHLGKSLHVLSNRLGGLGRWEEGLAAIGEAVEIYRRLAEQRPDAHLPDLAMGLNNLSLRLGDLGRREEGLAAIGEAVEIYRRLAEQRPDAHLPDLAGSLNNLSVDLGDLGGREEGLVAIGEAVEIYRRLTEHQSAYAADLDRSLRVLAWLKAGPDQPSAT